MDNFKNDINRRKFIEAGLKTAGAAALATVPSLNSFAGKREPVNDVIEIIYKDVPGAGFNRQTVIDKRRGKPGQGQRDSNNDVSYYRSDQKDDRDGCQFYHCSRRHFIITPMT